MEKLKKIIQSEVFLYLLAGVATTLVYMITRKILFTLTQHTLASVSIANITAVLFAFATNDRFVFRQQSKGWPQRLVKFVSARISTFFLDMLLAFLLVDTFPQIIGQFVNHNRDTVNDIATLISQVLMMVLNYVLSKLFVFTKKNES